MVSKCFQLDLRIINLIGGLQSLFMFYWCGMMASTDEEKCGMAWSVEPLNRPGCAKIGTRERTGFPWHQRVRFQWRSFWLGDQLVHRKAWTGTSGQFFPKKGTCDFLVLRRLLRNWRCTWCRWRKEATKFEKKIARCQYQQVPGSAFKQRKTTNCQTRLCAEDSSSSSSDTSKENSWKSGALVRLPCHKCPNW